MRPYYELRGLFFFLPKAVAEDELCAHDVRVLDISKWLLLKAVAEDELCAQVRVLDISK